MINRHTSSGGTPRRDFLRHAAAAAVATGMGNHALLARAIERSGGGLLGTRQTHHEAKAKHLIVLFLTGGFSHVDTFDYKPKLAAYDGKAVPSFGLRPDETRERPLLGSPFRFQAHGESGLTLSELFPLWARSPTNCA